MVGLGLDPSDGQAWQQNPCRRAALTGIDLTLQTIWPFGAAIFCGDISDNVIRFLKHGHNQHSNRRGGGFSRGWGA